MSAERKKLVKQLDDAFSKYIRERDNYTCIVCGVTNKTHVIQCGHLFSRVSNSTRWSESNANAQCSGCNMRHEYDFEPYRKTYVNKYGEKQYDIEYIKFKQTTKFSESDLKQMVELYKNKLKELQNEL